MMLLQSSLCACDALQKKTSYLEAGMRSLGHWYVVLSSYWRRIATSRDVDATTGCGSPFVGGT